MNEALVVRQLTKRYGNFQALHGISFSLSTGDIVGFLGPNGAGKSTTMKLVTGYLLPTSGSATVVGYDLTTNPLACRRSIGYLPEELPLYMDMTVAAYLDHIARLKEVPARQRRREVVDALDAAWITEHADRHIRKLSKGNRQRVGVAQALVARPPLLILDEPTSGLDPAQVAHFRDLLKSLATKHTILLSTHILAEVEAVCSRVIVIHGGRKVADEPIATLCDRASRVTRLRIRMREGTSERLRAACETAGWIQVLESSDDMVVVEAPPSRRGELVSLVEAHGGIREIIEERRSLEEVFRDLIAS